MFSLDWKERFNKDAVNFCKNNIPKKDYDIDLIYNAYPIRVQRKIPHEVVIYVAKKIADNLSGELSELTDFFDYLWTRKGEEGKLAFVTIISKKINLDSEFFLTYIQKLIFSDKDFNDLDILFEKIVYPLLKKSSLKQIENVLDWMKKGEENLNFAIIKMIVRLIKADKSLLQPIFSRLESNWLVADELDIKLYSYFLKATFKIDSDFYFSVYKRYEKTREPNFVEILTNAICAYNDQMFESAEIWAQSGNIRLKKAGQSALKLLKRKKK